MVFLDEVLVEQNWLPFSVSTFEFYLLFFPMGLLGVCGLRS